MIVTDDNFASIVAAIEEGRRIYDNIRNVVVYLIGGNMGEVMVVFFGVLFGLPLPLVATQILFVNLVTDGPPAIALAVESADPSSARRPPRRRDEPMLTRHIWAIVITRGALIATAVLGTFMVAYKILDYDLTTSRTIALTTLVAAHVPMAFLCRSLYTPVWKLPPFGNRQLIAGAIASLGALIAILVVPPFQDAFDTEMLDPGEFGLAILAAAMALVLIEALKVSPWRLRR
jgi:Ca2+-transporting ATPase